MKKLSLLLAIAFMLIPFNAFAGQEAHNWGTVNITGNLMTIDVREMLTKEKSGYMRGFAQDFKGARSNLTPEADKYFGIIWGTPGVANIVCSSYQFQIAKGSIFVWPEIEGEIYKAMDGWHAEVTKEGLALPKKEKTE